MLVKRNNFSGYDMKKFYEKHEFLFCMLLILIYIVINSICLNFFGITDYRTSIINILLSILFIIFIIKNKLGNYYGLTTFPSPKKYLYFIPLILIISVNFWIVINIYTTPFEFIFYIIFLISVGFLEEIIFRGFLFKMMEKDNVKTAIIVSSVTFGIGHIINLFNGADILPTLMQIMYATAAGYLFVTIFYKSKSLWPCIITHILVNSLSIFNGTENVISIWIAPVFLTIVSILYAMYINKTIK